MSLENEARAAKRQRAWAEFFRQHPETHVTEDDMRWTDPPESADEQLVRHFIDGKLSMTEYPQSLNRDLSEADVRRMAREEARAVAREEIARTEIPRDSSLGQALFPDYKGGA